MKGFAFLRQGHSRWTLLLACVLVLVLSSISIRSTNQLKNTLEMLIQHPVKVSSSAYETWRALEEMRRIMHGLIEVHSSADLAAQKEALAVAERELAGHTAYVYANYLGPHEQVLQLREQIHRLIVQQDLVLKLYESSPEAALKLTREMDSLYQDTGAILSSRILPFAHQRFDFFSREANGILQVNVLLTLSLLLTMILVALGIWTFTRRRMLDKRTREHMVGIIAENARTAFMIVNAVEAETEYVSPNIKSVLGIDDTVLRLSPCSFISHCTKGCKETEQLLVGLWDGPKELEMQLNDPETGAQRWVVVSAHAFLDEEHVEHRIISFCDTTQTRRNRQLLLDSLLGARLVNRTRRDFLSRMSYKLRSPVNAIASLTAEASNSLDNRVGLEICLAELGSASHQLLMMLTDIIDMTSIEDGRLSLSEELFHIDSLVSSATKSIEPQAQDKGVRLDTSFTLTHTKLIGDSSRLRQALDCVLSNALKFTPAGGSIVFQVEEVPEPQGDRARFRFTITDTGIGMSQEFQKNLFAPFAQESPETMQGTGLGMPIAKSIIDLLGGSISVHSEQGKGSSFSIGLSFRLGGVDRPPVEIEDLRALVVGNDPEECKSAAAALELMGIITEWTTSASEAAKRLSFAHQQEDDVDILFLHLELADIGGLQAVRRVRARFGDTPQIIVWGEDCPEKAMQVLKAGANDFISAPLLGSSLHGAIQRAARTLVLEVGESGKKTPPDFTGRHFLIADANPVSAEVAAELLRSAGAETENATDGDDAVERFLSSPHGHFDAILMTADMPVISSNRAAKTIRATGRPDATLPIIAMTESQAQADLALRAGMTAAMIKKLDMRLLAQLAGNQPQ